MDALLQFLGCTAEEMLSFLQSKLHRHSDLHSIVLKAEEGLRHQTNLLCIFSGLFCCGEVPGVKGAKVQQAAFNFGLDCGTLCSQLPLSPEREQLVALSPGGDHSALPLAFPAGLCSLLLQRTREQLTDLKYKISPLKFNPMHNHFFWISRLGLFVLDTL